MTAVRRPQTEERSTAIALTDERVRETAFRGRRGSDRGRLEKDSADDHELQPEMAAAELTSLRMLTLHGEHVAYREEGAGEVLLLIHGLGGSSDCWRDLVPKLSMRFRVIAPDLLGHGQSGKPRGDYSLGAFAVWLRDFLDALNIREATVVGHSFGGGVALQFAHQHQEYCRRLVLISSGGLGPDVGPLLRMLSLPGAELVLPLIASRPAIKVGNAFRRRAMSSGREVTRYSETLRAHGALSNRRNRSAFLRTLRSVVDHRGQAVCALNRLRVDLPTLIICGDQDRCIPVAHAYSAHNALPGSLLHVIPGAGHQPQVERPDTVARLVGDFIAGFGQPWHRTDAISDCVTSTPDLSWDSEQRPHAGDPRLAETEVRIRWSTAASSPPQLSARPPAFRERSMCRSDEQRPLGVRALSSRATKLWAKGR